MAFRKLLEEQNCLKIGPDPKKELVSQKASIFLGKLLADTGVCVTAMRDPVRGMN